jgi:hypothetical protein
VIISENNQIPELYAQEEVKDSLVYVSVRIGKAFWLLTEYDREKGVAFGWAELFAGGGELGYIFLPEIEEAIQNYSGEVINYDKPQKLSILKKEFQ